MSKSDISLNFKIEGKQYHGCKIMWLLPSKSLRQKIIVYGGKYNKTNPIIMSKRMEFV